MKPVWIEAFKDRKPQSLVDYWLFALLIFTVPFFVLIGAHDGFILSKYVYMAIGASLLLGVHFSKFLFGKPFTVPAHLITLLWIIFFVWQLIASTWADSGVLAKEQLWQWGTVTLLVLFFQSTLYQNRRRLLGLGALIIFAGPLISLWVLALDYVRVFSPDALGIATRLGDWRDQISPAGFGNTGHIADFLVICFLATLCGLFTVEGKKRIGLMLSFLWLEAAALIVCWSFHSNLSLLISALVLGVLLIKRWRFEPKWKARLKRLWVAVLGWIVVVAFFAVDQPLNPHHSNHWKHQAEIQQIKTPVSFGIFGEAFASPRWKEGGTTRVAIWKTTQSVIKEYPFLGAGTGNFTYAYPQADASALQEDPDLAKYAHSWTNAAHNTLLQTWSEIGIVGVLLLIGIIVTAFVCFWRRMNSESTGNYLVLAFGFSALLAMVLQAQMNFLFELPVSSLLFGCIISIPIVLELRVEHPPLIMPVTREFGPLELGINLKNMQVPTSLIFQGRLPRVVSIIGSVLVLIGVAALAVPLSAPLRASMAYKHVYEEVKALKNGMRLRDESALLHDINQVLAIDPAHREALSDKVTLLIMMRNPQSFGTALEANDELAKQLSDYKVFYYKAQALEGLGRSDEANEYWQKTFEMAPNLKAGFPYIVDRLQDTAGSNE